MMILMFGVVEACGLKGRRKCLFGILKEKWWRPKFPSFIPIDPISGISSHSPVKYGIIQFSLPPCFPIGWIFHPLLHPEQHFISRWYKKSQYFDCWCYFWGNWSLVFPHTLPYIGGWFRMYMVLFRNFILYFFSRGKIAMLPQYTVYIDGCMEI